MYVAVEFFMTLTLRSCLTSLLFYFWNFDPTRCTDYIDWCLKTLLQLHLAMCNTLLVWYRRKTRICRSNVVARSFAKFILNSQHFDSKLNDFYKFSVVLITLNSVTNKTLIFLWIWEIHQYQFWQINKFLQIFKDVCVANFCYWT